MVDQKLLDELKSKHGSAFPITVKGGKYHDDTDFVVKRPPRGEYKRFRAMLFKDDEKAEALETLALACIVYPEPAEFRKLLEERPALAEKIGGECAEIAGGGDAEGKKL